MSSNLALVSSSNDKLFSQMSFNHPEVNPDTTIFKKLASLIYDNSFIRFNKINTVLCRNNGCNKEKCTFAHSNEELKKGICLYYFGGKCVNRDDKCEYSHNIKDAELTLDKFNSSKASGTLTNKNRKNINPEQQSIIMTQNIIMIMMNDDIEDEKEKFLDEVEIISEGLELLDMEMYYDYFNNGDDIYNEFETDIDAINHNNEIDGYMNKIVEQNNMINSCLQQMFSSLISFNPLEANLIYYPQETTITEYEEEYEEEEEEEEDEVDITL